MVLTELNLYINVMDIQMSNQMIFQIQNPNINQLR